MRNIGLAACALCTVMLLGACGSSTSSSSGSSSRAEGGAAAGVPAPANSGQRSGQNGQQPPLPGPNAGRAIVYTANLQVRSRNVADAAARAKQLVTGSGGFVSTESESNTDSADLTFKVPTAQYASVLDQLTKLGTKVSLQQNTEDVTEQVADVNSRVQSAQATIASFRKLLDKANTIGDVLDVEQQIASRESDLEALQARQKALTEQTSYGTITLSLVAPSTSAPNSHHGGGGFTGGLSAGWAAFVAAMSALATAIGWLLPFLVLAALVALPILTVRRRRTARRSISETPEEKEPAESK